MNKYDIMIAVVAAAVAASFYFERRWSR